MSVHVIEPFGKKSILSLEQSGSMLRNSSLVVSIVVWSCDSWKMSKVWNTVDLMTITALNSCPRSSWCQFVYLVPQWYWIESLHLVIYEWLLIPVLFFVDVLRLGVRSVSFLLYFAIVKSICGVWCRQSYCICNLVPLHLASLISLFPIGIDIHSSLEKAFRLIDCDGHLRLWWNELSVGADFLISDTMLHKT